MAISLKIGSTTRSSYLHYDSIPSYDLQRGVRGQARIPLCILDGDSYTPSEGQPIYLYEDITCIFAGTIDTMDRTWLSKEGAWIHQLTCVGLEQCFDTIRILSPRTYVNRTAAYIVSDLLTNVCTGVPVTAGTISTGATIPYVMYDASTTITDIFSSLAQASGFIWYVRYSDQTLQFHVDSSSASPITLQNADILWDNLGWNQSRKDYRNRQIVRVSLAAFAPSNAVFAGDNVTTSFVLPVAPSTIEAVIVGDMIQASAIGTFTGNPSPGDTVTVNDAVYTFVAALDNTALDQVLIGATVADTCQNLVDAINSNPSTADMKFSLPTWENDACNAENTTVLSPLAVSLVVKEKFGGSAGNSVPIAKSCSVFSWPGATLSGGSDGTTRIVESFGVSGIDQDKYLYYTLGVATVTTTRPQVFGAYLSIQYRGVGRDCIAVEDTALVAARAAVEGGTGKYQQYLDDSQNTSALAGYYKAVAILAQYKVLPITFSFQCDRGPGLVPGLWQTISIASPAPANLVALVNGTWLIQEVSGQLIPGGDVAPGMGYFRHTIHVTNAIVPSWLAVWEQFVAQLSGSSSSSAGGSSGAGGGGGDATAPGLVDFTPALYQYGWITAENVSVGSPTTQTAIDWYLLYVDELTADVWVTTDASADGTTDPLTINVTDNPDLVTLTSVLDFEVGSYVLWNDNGKYEIGQITAISGSAPHRTFTIERLSVASPATGWFGSSIAAHASGTQLFVAQLRRMLPNSQEGTFNSTPGPTRYDFDLPAACVLAIMAAAYDASPTGPAYGDFNTVNCATADLPGIRTCVGQALMLQKTGTLAANSGVNIFQSARMPFSGMVRVSWDYVATAPTGASLKVNIRRSSDGGSTWTLIEQVVIPATDFNNWAGDPPQDRQAPYSGTWPFPIWSAGDLLNASIEQVGSTIAGADLSIGTEM